MNPGDSGNGSDIQPRTAFELLGGQAVIDQLVDDFYDRMDALPQAAKLRAIHAADLGPIRTLLKKYLGEWLGGPRRYTPERGTPMLRRRHQPFDIDASARDAWMACMRQALASTCSDGALIAELEAAFDKVAAHLRNTVE